MIKFLYIITQYCRVGLGDTREKILIAKDEEIVTPLGVSI